MRGKLRVELAWSGVLSYGTLILVPSRLAGKSIVLTRNGGLDVNLSIIQRSTTLISNQNTLLQLDRHKEEIATVYNLASSGYDQAPLNFFPLAAARLVELLKIEPGQQILDIGTGTGIAAILAAKHCQPHGQVIGIDIARQMLEVAVHKVEAAQISNLELQLGDGENLSFTDN